MKFNLNVPMLDIDGKAVKDEMNTDILLKNVCSSALISMKQGIEEDGKKKLEKFNLAIRLGQSNGEIDLTAEEIVLIKESVSIFNGPLPYGRVCEILDK